MAESLTSPIEPTKAISSVREVYFHLLKSKKQEVAVVEANMSPNLPPLRNPRNTYFRTECTKNSKINQERSVCSSMSKHVKQKMRDCLAEVSKDPSVDGMKFQARIPFYPQYFIKGNCLDDGTQQQVTRYKIRFSQYDKETKVVTAESHIKEQEDGTFKLVWTRLMPKEYRTQCKVKFDIVRPGSSAIRASHAPGSHKVDIRIVNLLDISCCSEDEDVNKIAEKIAKSTSKTPVGELSMQVVGSDFCVEFIRKKCITEYKWKENPDWSIVQCEGTNWVDIDSHAMRRSHQTEYDLITVHFKEPTKEISLNGATCTHRKTEEHHVSRVDQFLVDFEGFVGTSFLIAEMLEDSTN